MHVLGTLLRSGCKPPIRPGSLNRSDSSVIAAHWHLYPQRCFQESGREWAADALGEKIGIS